MLWEMDRLVTAVLCSTQKDARYNKSRQVSIYWLDAMFWPSVHSCARRIVQNELFRAIADLNTIRISILGPLVAASQSSPSRGVRRFEFRFPSNVDQLSGTITPYGAAGCFTALEAAITCFRKCPAIAVVPKQQPVSRTSSGRTSRTASYGKSPSS